MTLSEQSESKSKSWFVYICVSAASHYYTGISVDPIRRVKAHNNGSGAKMSKDQGGFKLVYVSTPIASKSLARIREIQIKGWNRLKKEKLISGEWS